MNRFHHHLLAISAAFLTVPAMAQVAVVVEAPMTVSSLTAGNEFGHFSDDYVTVQGDLVPTSRNRPYADEPDKHVDILTIPQRFQGSRSLQTIWADRGSATLTASFTMDRNGLVCAWLDDGIETAGALPSWLNTDQFENFGYPPLSVQTRPHSAWCKRFEAGAPVTLGPNLATADAGTPFNMYVVSITSGAFAPRSINSGPTPPPDADCAPNGCHTFSAPAFSVNESTVDCSTIKLRRILNSVGAVTVDVVVTGGSCTPGVDYVALTGNTHEWAEGDLSNRFQCITVNSLSADCDLTLAFANPTGGIEAYSIDGVPERQTPTVALLDVAQPAAADLVMSELGNDANDCLTVPTACKTHARVDGIADPGDTVSVLADGPTWVIPECPAFARDGTVTGRWDTAIKYVYEAGKNFRYYPPADCGTIWNFTTANYRIFDGCAAAEVSVGNRGEWNSAQNRKSYTHSETLRVGPNASHIDFRCITFSGAKNYVGALIAGGTTRMYNSSWDKHGCNGGPNCSGTGSDSGDMLVVRGANTNYFVSDGSTYQHGGHNSLNVNSNYGMLLNGDMNGDWRDLGSPFGDGQRSFILSPGADNGSNGGLEPNGYWLVQGNIIRNGLLSEETGLNAQACAKFEGVNLTVRFNYFYNCNAAAASGANNPGGFTTAGAPQIEHIYFGHNVMDQVGACLRYVRVATTTNFAEIDFINNLCTRVSGKQQNAEQALIWFDQRGVPLQGYLNAWKGAQIRNTIFNEAVGSSAGADTIKLQGTAGATVQYENCVTQWPQTCAGNDESTVAYVNQDDFTTTASHCIQSGIGIGDAGPVARVTQAVTNGAVVPVDRPDRFWPADIGPGSFDWYEDPTTPGTQAYTNDRIVINGLSREVVDRDDAARTITLDIAVTVAANDPIYHEVSGAIADNRGACQ